MRGENEIVMAHDRLTAMILGDVPWPFKEPRRRIEEARVIAACDVLCWILKHDHNQTFADNLATIDKALAARGFTLQPLPGGR